MRIFNYFVYSLVLTVLMLIWGCGSGGGGTAGESKFVSKATLDAPAPGVKGIQITLILPATVIPELDATGKPAVTLLGQNNVTQNNGLLYVTYTPASGSASGTVQIIVIRGDTPFEPGDFFSLPCVVEAGKPIPTQDQFGYTDLKVWDSNGNDITSPSSGAIVTAAAR